MYREVQVSLVIAVAGGNNGRERRLIAFLLLRGMQDCFRAHPDIYGGELDDEEEDMPDTLPEDAPSDPSGVPAKPLDAAHANPENAHSATIQPPEPRSDGESQK